MALLDAYHPSLVESGSWGISHPAFPACPMHGPNMLLRVENAAQQRDAGSCRVRGNHLRDLQGGCEDVDGHHQRLLCSTSPFQ